MRPKKKLKGGTVTATLRDEQKKERARTTKNKGRKKKHTKERK